jgi:hypothetical protein
MRELNKVRKVVYISQTMDDLLFRIQMRRKSTLSKKVMQQEQAQIIQEGILLVWEKENTKNEC